MPLAAIQFELLWDPGASAGGAAASVGRLAVPCDPQFLIAVRGRDPAFSPVADESVPGSVLLHPVLRGPLAGPSVVLLAVGVVRVRVNGHPAPLVAILRERDCVQVDDAVFFVALRVAPSIVAVDDAGLDPGECPICSTPFRAKQLVYLCPFCDAPMHAGGEGGLDCFSHATECRRCHRAVVRRPTYTSFPELGPHALVR